VNPRSPLYLRILARVTQLLLVSLACALWPSFGDPLAGRGYVVQEVGGFCGKIGDNLCLAATASVHLLVLDRGIL
jgi:hypothetical protein